MYSLHMSWITGKLDSFVFLNVILRNSDPCYLMYLEFYKWLENRLYQLGFGSFVKWPWLIKTEHKPSQCFNTPETNWISLESLHVRKAAPLPWLSSRPGVLSRVSVPFCHLATALSKLCGSPLKPSAWTTMFSLDKPAWYFSRTAFTKHEGKQKRNNYRKHTESKNSPVPNCRSLLLQIMLETGKLCWAQSAFSLSEPRPFVPPGPAGMLPPIGTSAISEPHHLKQLA